MTHSLLPNMTRVLRQYPSAVFMLALLSICAIVAISTFASTKVDLLPEEITAETVIKGRTSIALEKAYEKELVGKDIAVASWGAVRYGLTKTGNKGVIIGKDGWLFTKEEFEEFGQEKEAESRKLAMIMQVNKYLKSFGIKLIVAVIPSKTRVYEEYLGDVQWPQWRRSLYDRFMKDLKNKKIVAPRMLEKFMEGKNHSQLFMKTDTHWSPAGAAMVATQMDAAAHEAFPDLQLTKANYLSLEQPAEPYDGDLNEFVPTGLLKPLIGPNSEPLARHKTTKMEDESTADAGASLFGDTAIDVVLVGTSYSFEKEWNFEWALKEALMTDVLNVAEEGNGPMVPMGKWLKSQDFSGGAARPKLVIWEIPERFIPKHYDALDWPSLTIE